MRSTSDLRHQKVSGSAVLGWTLASVAPAENPGAKARSTMIATLSVWHEHSSDPSPSPRLPRHAKCVQIGAQALAHFRLTDRT